MPAVHEEQIRFVVAVWAVLMYSPATQSVNDVQTRSTVVVGVVLSYSVLPLHAPVTAVQLEAFVVVE